MTEKKIVRVAFLVEGLLILSFAVWSELRDFHLDRPTLHDLLLASLCTIPLLVINHILFSYLASRLPFLKDCLRFQDLIIKPFVITLSHWSIISISVLAGIGEELFFRGIIQSELGLIIASLSFALLHFGKSVLTFPVVAAIYFFIGCYLGLLYEMSGTLWLPIFTHILYDYAALIYLRYLRSMP